MTTRNGGAARLGRRTALGVAAAFALAAALPALASASTVFVSKEPVKAPFNSCAAPASNSIQEAVTVSPAKSTIHVCVGQYKEQVRIEKQLTVAAEPGATLELPASPAESTTTCDKPPEQDLLAICGAIKVAITGLTLDGKWAEPSCESTQKVDIVVGGKANLTLTGSTILHAGPEPINGCQNGLAILVGRNSTNQVGTAKLSADVIEGYDKNGVTVDGPGSSATISGVTVKSAPTDKIAQNGIQVSRGAKVKISGSTIEGNECNVTPNCSSNPSANEDATGILFFEGASGSSVTNSTIKGNDYGLYNLLNSGSAKTSISGDKFQENRYWGIALDQGSAAISGNTISGPGNVGIQLNQYASQAFSATGAGKSDTITGMGLCAVEGISDNEPADKPASLTLRNSLSKFSGDKTAVCSNATGNMTISVT